MRFSSNKGFTLIELLIAIAVITVITSFVLVRFTTFDSTVVLKNKAYEVGLLLRELQVKSVSVQRSSTEFDYPFGVTFSTSTANYITFYYSSSSPDVYPYYDLTCQGNPAPIWDCANELERMSVGEQHEVSDICYTIGSNPERCASSDPTDFRRIDISFKRPEFNALIYVDDDDFVGNPNTISNAKIKIESTKGGTGPGTFVVEVTKLGQISVYNE